NLAEPPFGLSAPTRVRNSGHAERRFRILPWFRSLVGQRVLGPRGDTPVPDPVARVALETPFRHRAPELALSDDLFPAALTPPRVGPVQVTGLRAVVGADEAVVLDKRAEDVLLVAVLRRCALPPGRGVPALP